MRDPLRRLARVLGPRAADLGSGAASRCPGTQFVVALAGPGAAAAPLVRGDLRALPIAGGALTGVLAGESPDRDAAAREIARVLQPGGHAIVAGDASAWEAALARAAFAVASRDGVVVATKKGGVAVDIPRPSLLSMFVPRAWLDRRRVN